MNGKDEDLVGALFTYAIRQSFSDKGIGAAYDVRSLVEPMARRTSFCLSARVLGQEFGRDPYEWPADWWQALKDRWFPQWALRRWPVLRSGVEMRWRVLYPDFNVVEGMGRAPIVWEAFPYDPQEDDE